MTFANSHPLHPKNDKSPIVFNANELNLSLANTSKSNRVPLQEDGRWHVRSKVANKLKLCLRSTKGLDFRSKLWMCLDVSNKGREKIVLRGKAFESWTESLGGVAVPAGGKATLYIHLPRKAETDEDELFGKVMGMPNGTYRSSWRQLTLDQVKNLDLWIYTDGEQLNVELSQLRAAGKFIPLKDYAVAPKKRPYVDVFGQNTLEDWVGKIHSVQDMKDDLERELSELEKQPGEAGLSLYGGSLASPRQEARGHFYTTKIDGKWWFVDPQGYLFWSFGLTSIGYGGDTAEPAIDELRSKAQGRQKIGLGTRPGIWNPGKSNLLQKYGENWKEVYPKMVNRRLKSWGLNTLGNWTKKEFYSLKKIPYTLAVHFGRPEVKVGEQAKSLPDAFHPEFERSLSRALARMSQEAKDPWCLGFFIDNELDFGNNSLKTGQIIFDGNKASHTRRAMIDMLKNKYGVIEALNSAWAKTYSNWEALEGHLPLRQKACREDALEMGRIYLDKYFSTCTRLMKKYAPHKLYLGSRIHFKENTLALEASSRHCDVVSVNYYDFSPLTVKWPKAVNKPVIIGEYHFGTTNESGVWGGGLCASVDLKHAAAQFKAYTEQAYKDPRYVGAHYFQLKDQVVTGRKDGENYRIGFLDIADQIYPEMVKRAREVAREMYLGRLKNQ